MTKHLMMRWVILGWTMAVFGGTVLVPAVAQAQAQASITGIIKDASGAVLPGVTVEAASPVLIERVRADVSDGNGQYRILNLVPGVYSVTFTLTGFSTLKREGVELAGDFAASINVEMKVGAQEETITVTGEAPLVDTQSITRQTVINYATVEAIPTGKYVVSLGALIPGLSVSCSAGCRGSNAQDTGGSSGDPGATLIAHGSRFRDQRLSFNNTTIRGSTGYTGNTDPNMEAMLEAQVDTSGSDGSVGTGGVRVNFVPKEGGNLFSGSFFGAGTNEHFQGNNVSQSLKDRGLVGTTKVKTLYDAAATLGGPVMKDKLWFFLSARGENNLIYGANLFANANKNLAAACPGPNCFNSYTYVPDLSSPASLGNPLPMLGGRLTWQATPKNKFSISYDYRDKCICPDLANGGTAPEAAGNFIHRPDQYGVATWASPVTNRLLLQATFADLVEGWSTQMAKTDANVGIMRVTAQNIPASFLNISTYRGVPSLNNTWYPYRDSGFTATYVTGSHVLKAGIDYDWGFSDAVTYANNTSINGVSSIQLNFASGVPSPNQFTVNAGPAIVRNKIPYDGGVYAQDKWTFKRVTLSGGLRWEYFNRYTPATTLGPTLLFPTRNITFPRQQVINYRDLSPRTGVAWDVFGNGRTAVKASLNRYTLDNSLLANGGQSVLAAYQSTASRSWTDSNGNFFPDCDFANPAAQNLAATGGDVCGAFTGANANFNLAIPTTTNDQATVSGFNHRPDDWEFSAEVTQEVIPRRMSLDVAFFRRSYGNFTVTDNLTTQASDYSTFSVVVPTDSRLPLSGQTITGFYDTNTNVASLPSNNFITFAKNFGKQTETWQGIDVTTSVRLVGSLRAQGGFSTGKQTVDACPVLAKVPEATVSGISLIGSPSTIAGPLSAPFCHQESPFLLQVKGLASYTIPKVGIDVAGTFQTVPGPQLAATLVVPCGAGSAIAAQLGRNCTAAGGNVTVNVLNPGSAYGDRLYQTDFRIGKAFRFSNNRRASANVDLYNAFNNASVLTQQSSYSLSNLGLWGTPLSMQQARFLKFSLSVNF